MHANVYSLKGCWDPQVLCSNNLMEGLGNAVFGRPDKCPDPEYFFIKPNVEISHNADIRSQAHLLQDALHLSPQIFARGVLRSGSVNESEDGVDCRALHPHTKASGLPMNYREFVNREARKTCAGLSTEPSFNTIVTGLIGASCMDSRMETI